MSKADGIRRSWSRNCAPEKAETSSDLGARIGSPSGRDIGLPPVFAAICRRYGISPTRYLLIVDVLSQSLFLLERIQMRVFPNYYLRQRYVISTSRFGVGQRAGSHQTPLGLHRIAEKVGAGQPVGTTFTNRRAVGLTWQGKPAAPIAHRVLWLEGLEPGINRGGSVDTHARFIYVHGVGDESRLGRPASKGCIHLAAADLLPLYDLLPTGTLVWIGKEMFTGGGWFGKAVPRRGNGWAVGHPH